MVGELASLHDSVSSRPPRWIQITTAVEKRSFGDSLERRDVPYSHKLTGLVHPFSAAMDDIVADDRGPDRRRSFTIHRGTFLLQEEELVQEVVPERPEVSPRKRFPQVVDQSTPGRENWTLSHSYLSRPTPSGSPQLTAHHSWPMEPGLPEATPIIPRRVRRSGPMPRR